MGNLLSGNNHTITIEEFEKYQNDVKQTITELNNKVELLTSLKTEIDTFVTNEQQSHHTETQLLNNKIKWLENHVSQLDRNIHNTGLDDRINIQSKINELGNIIDKLNNNVGDYLNLKENVRVIQQKLDSINLDELSQTQQKHYNTTDEEIDIPIKNNYSSNNIDYLYHNDGDIEDNEDNEDNEDETNETNEDIDINTNNDTGNIKTNVTSGNVVTDAIYNGSNIIYSGVKYPITMIGNAFQKQEDMSKENMSKENISEKKDDTIKTNVTYPQSYIEHNIKDDPLLQPVNYPTKIEKKELKQKNKLLGTISSFLNNKQPEEVWNKDDLNYYYNEKSSNPI